MSQQLKGIQRILEAKADKGNQIFSKKWYPASKKIYGIKTPELNTLVQQDKNYSFDLAEELWQSGALEEKLIAIKILEKTGKKDPDRLLKLHKKFAGDIGNWAVCDGLGMQFLRGIVTTHAEEIFALASKYNRSRDPWQRRLSLVMVEWYTRKKEYHPAIKQLVSPLVNDEDYYVKKAIVWINRNFSKGK